MVLERYLTGRSSLRQSVVRVGVVSTRQPLSRHRKRTKTRQPLSVPGTTLKSFCTRPLFSIIFSTASSERSALSRASKYRMIRPLSSSWSSPETSLLKTSATTPLSFLIFLYSSTHVPPPICTSRTSGSKTSLARCPAPWLARAPCPLLPLTARAPPPSERTKCWPEMEEKSRATFPGVACT